MTACMEATTRSVTRSMRLQAWFPWIIATFGLLVYANSFPGPFIFDDAVVITNNPHIYHLWPPWKAVQSPARFLADYSFALNFAWSGNCPADFRLVNILIHIGASLLLYGIVRHTLRLPLWQTRYQASADLVAFSIALLWTLHPLQTESVTYIAQRIEALMALFFLLTLYLFMRGTLSKNARPWYIWAFITCLFGMGTKEVMITVPPLILLYDAVFISGSWATLFQKRWKIHVALFSTWLFLALLIKLAVMRALAEDISLFTSELSRWNYALTQLNVVAHYFRLSLIPSPLCLDYYWPLVGGIREAIWPGAVTLLAGVGTLWGLWRRSWIGFLGAWVFMILAPTSSFNPLPDAAFEHRMYLPLAAVLTFFVISLFWLIQRCANQTPRRGIRVFGTVIFLAGVTFGLLTIQRNTVYQSEETMWRDVMKTRPDNFRPYVSLSSVLLNARRYAEAEIVCSNFLLRCPDFSKMTFDEASQFFRPGAQPLPMYYAMIQNNLGLTAINQNSIKQAKQHYREALRIFPTIEASRRNLGHALFNENNLDEAIAEWQLNLNVHPRDYKSLEALGVAFSEKHQFEMAASAFAAAVAIKPDLWFSRAQLAWLQATCPDDRVRNGVRALQMALPLLNATREQSSKALDIIAAAHAEIGNYAQALDFCERALSLISSNTHPAEVTAINMRCGLYREQRPFRQPPLLTPSITP